MPNKFRFIFLAAFIFFSHYILPHFFENKEFLIFAPYNMFSNLQYIKTHDIYFPQKNLYLFRDKRDEARQAGIDIHTLFYKLNSADITELSPFYHKLQKFCMCDQIQKVQMSSSLSEHFLYKVDSEILSQVNLNE